MARIKREDGRSRPAQMTLGKLIKLGIALVVITYAALKIESPSTPNRGASSRNHPRVRQNRVYSSTSGRGQVTVAQNDPLIRQIPTELWLYRDIKVHVLKMDDWWETQPPESGLMLYFLDGIREHPRVHLVEEDEADFLLHFVLHTNMSSYPEFADPADRKVYDRLVVIDENDHFDNSFHTVFRDQELLAFFKRSFVNKKEGEPTGIDRQSGTRDFPFSHWPMADNYLPSTTTYLLSETLHLSLSNQAHNYLPFSYGIARRYIAGFWDASNVMAYDRGDGRDIPLVCSLREYHKPAWPGGRENVFSWLAEMKITGAVLGEVSDWKEGNRGADSKPYIDAMKRAQIVVNANPGNWEGDFRFWEALASKALVFNDYFYTPIPEFFIDGEDVIFFDPMNKEDLEAKIRYYLDHPEEARRIAMNGYYKAMRYHRYVNRVDYVMTTVAMLLDGTYQHSGWGMKEWAMRSRVHIHDPDHGLRKWPGKPLSLQEQEKKSK